MELGNNNVLCSKGKVEKDKQMLSQESIGSLGMKEITSTWKYWKQTPSNKQRIERKIKQNSSEEQENFLKPKSATGILSKQPASL